MRDPYTDLEINCRAQLSILEACRKHNPAVAVVFASTRQIYGRPQYLPVDERAPARPGRRQRDQQARGRVVPPALRRGVRHSACRVLRLTNTYGPRMRVKDARQTFLGFWLRQIAQRRGAARLRRRRAAARLQLRRRRRPRAPARRGARRGRRPDLQPRRRRGAVSARARGAARARARLRARTALVPFPDDRKAIDIGDYYATSARSGTSSAGQPAVELEDGLERSLAFYREHGEALLGAVTRVPFLDLARHVAAIRDGARRGRRGRARLAAASSLGEPVERFERDFAA